MALEEVFEESGKNHKGWGGNARSLRIGELILICDADTIVPEVRYFFFLHFGRDADEVRIGLLPRRRPCTRRVSRGRHHPTRVRYVASVYLPICALYSFVHPPQTSCKCPLTSSRTVSPASPAASTAPSPWPAPTAKSLLSSDTMRSSAGLLSRYVYPSHPILLSHSFLISLVFKQDAAFIDEADGKKKMWSESNVSEDFDMALRLQLRGYIIRWSSYSQGGFKEGVSLTVDDELNRWQKYSYGALYPPPAVLLRADMTRRAQAVTNSSSTPSSNGGAKVPSPNISASSSGPTHQSTTKYP